jgi:hypothetical protein
MINRYLQFKFGLAFSAVVAIFTLFIFMDSDTGRSLMAASKKESSILGPDGKMPVVRWTVMQNNPGFVYIDEDFQESLEHITLYHAVPEGGTWNHHTMIFLHDNVLYASWDQHKADENGPGQHGLLRRSYDHGLTWGPVEELFPPLAPKVSVNEPHEHSRFQSNNGFIIIEGRLYAFTDVADWTSAGREKIKPRIKIGHLVRAFNDDGSLGELFWMSESAPEPVEGFPYIPAGDPVLIGKIQKYLKLPGNEPQLSFSVGHPTTDDNHGTREPSAWRLDSGIWVKMYGETGRKDARNNREAEASKVRRNYVSFSFDEGVNWTIPTRTNFPDACGRSCSGKLPDGQVFVINAGWPMSNKYGGRTLQLISLSRDGLTFDRATAIQFRPPEPRNQGRSKREGYQAHAVAAGDYLVVMSSVNKEDIVITRIPLSALNAL